MNDKYTRYKVTTEHGVSQTVWAPWAADARRDFEATCPGIAIQNIELVSA